MRARKEYTPFLVNGKSDYHKWRFKHHNLYANQTFALGRTNVGGYTSGYLPGTNNNNFAIRAESHVFERIGEFDSGENSGEGSQSYGDTPDWILKPEGEIILGKELDIDVQADSQLNRITRILIDKNYPNNELSTEEKKIYCQKQKK